MSKKLKIIIPIIIVLLLLAGIAWGVYAFIMNTPKNAYLKSEQHTAEKYQNYVDERFKNELEFQDKFKDNSFVSQMDINLNVSDKLIKGMGLPKSLVDASKIEGKIGHDPKAKKSIIQLNPTIADSNIGKFQWAADDNNQYFESPLFKDIYSVSNKELVKTDSKISGITVKNLEENGITNQNSTLNLNSVLGKAQSQQDDLDTLVKSYSNILIKHVDDDDFTKGKKQEIKINGAKHKVKKLTLKISREKAKEITVAALKHAQKDDDLRKILANDLPGKEYDKEMKKRLKKAQDTQEQDYPKIESDIYVEGKDILKRNVKITDKDDKTTNLKGTNTLDDNKLKLDYVLDLPEDNNLNLKVVSSGEDKSYKDDIELSSTMNYDHSKVNISNKEKVDGHKRKDQGDITLNLHNNEEQKLTYENTLDTDAKNNQQKQKLNIGFKLSQEPVNIIINNSTKLKEKIDFNTAGAKDFNKLSKKERKKLIEEIEKSTKKKEKDIIKKLD